MAISENREAASLIAQITAAFYDVVRGEGTSLHETAVLDDYGSDSDRQEAREWDTDVHWWDISDETLYSRGFYVTYLDAEGLRYYLPAWMIHSLKILQAPQTGCADTRTDTLELLILSDRPGRYDLAAYQRDKWKLLTAEQNRVVCLYLRYVACHSTDRFNVRNALKALEQHWGQFCKDNLSN